MTLAPSLSTCLYEAETENPVVLRRSMSNPASPMIFLSSATDEAEASTAEA